MPKRTADKCTEALPALHRVPGTLWLALSWLYGYASPRPALVLHWMVLGEKEVSTAGWLRRLMLGKGHLIWCFSSYTAVCFKGDNLLFFLFLLFFFPCNKKAVVGYILVGVIDALLNFSLHALVRTLFIIDNTTFLQQLVITTGCYCFKTNI